MKSMHAMDVSLQGTIDPDTFDAEQNSIFNEYELANISKIAEWEEQKASQGN